MSVPPNLDWFKQARYGLFIHYGLYSQLGRGEWVMNKEEIQPADYARLAKTFRPDALDFDWLIGKAKRDWGMRYAVLTTKHHEGFCLYDSSLTDYSAPKVCGRDLVREFVDACRKHDMRVCLYHSLNDWYTSPNAVDALEDPAKHAVFIDYVHGQIRDLLTQYGPVDTMWYDGWWPFNADGWKAQQLNDMVRALVPGILINGRSGLAGDFETPEQHVSASARPWEGCVTLNDSWGYHAGDQNWKSPRQVVHMLQMAAAGSGNLLLNVGPRGDGSIPEASLQILDTVGAWLKQNGDCIYRTERYSFDLQTRGDHRADWCHHGAFTAGGNDLYLLVRSWPGSELVLCGLETRTVAASFLADGSPITFKQQGGKLTLSGMPAHMDTTMPVVIRMTQNAPPVHYKTGGLRNPAVDHCRYDPCPSEIAHGSI